MTAGKVKVKVQPDDWQPPQVDAAGQQVDADGLPLARAARAKALADAGRKSDPAGIVTADEIGSLNPKAQEADHQAVRDYYAEKNDRAAADAAAILDETTAAPSAPAK